MMRALRPTQRASATPPKSTPTCRMTSASSACSAPTRSSTSVAGALTGGRTRMHVLLGSPTPAAQHVPSPTPPASHPLPPAARTQDVRVLPARQLAAAGQRGWQHAGGRSQDCAVPGEPAALRGAARLPQLCRAQEAVRAPKRCGAAHERCKMSWGAQGRLQQCVWPCRQAPMPAHACSAAAAGGTAARRMRGSCCKRGPTHAVC